MFKEVIKYFKDALFPVRCLNCEKEGEWVCQKCFIFLDCDGFCREDHWAISKYQDDLLIGKIIRKFKYNYVKELYLVFEKMIELFFQNNPDVFKDIDCIIPVPLHKKRFAERGFNQSEIIANIISQMIHKSVVNSLSRVTNTKHQARLSKEERLTNTKSAFRMVELVSGKVLLVDDVYTTGSTIAECKKELLANGATSVTSFTIARG